MTQLRVACSHAACSRQAPSSTGVPFPIDAPSTREVPSPKEAPSSRQAPSLRKPRHVPSPRRAVAGRVRDDKRISALVGLTFVILGICLVWLALKPTNVKIMDSTEQKSQHVAILGCGVMGTAVLEGWLKKGTGYTFTAHTRTEASSKRLQEELAELSSKVTFTHGDDKLVQATKDATVVLLGFLPTQLQSVLKDLALAETLKHKTVISMLAGVSISQVQDALTEASQWSARAEDFHVSRIIPTLGVKVNDSVTLIADPAEPTASTESAQLVQHLFDLLGSPQHISEALMDEATAIQSAIHALAIVAVDSATDVSVADGLPRSTAQGLIAASLKSAAGLISSGAYTPESLKAGMSTPAGITMNSLVQLNAEAAPGIARSVRGAVRYTRSMNE